MNAEVAGDTIRVRQLFTKPERGEPMVEVPALDLVRPFASADQTVGRERPFGFSPRQICIAESESLDEHGVKGMGARCDLVLESADGLLASGALLTLRRTQIRITLACEPCAHGARLADAPMSRFRQIRRFLGLVLAGGTVDVGAPAVLHPDVWEAVPDTFRERCAWAVDRIPRGRVTTSLELLAAIGASKAYLRALPRWIRLAGAGGGAVHRVLTAGLGVPSWAQDARSRLQDEGITPDRYAEVNYPLSALLWQAEVPPIRRGISAIETPTTSSSTVAESRSRTGASQ